MRRAPFRTVTRKSGHTFDLYHYNKRWIKIPKADPREVERALAKAESDRTRKA